MNQLTEIATLLITVALISMLVQRSGNASQLIATTGQTFGNLLQQATLQNGLFGGANTAQRF